MHDAVCKSWTQQQMLYPWGISIKPTHLPHLSGLSPPPPNLILPMPTDLSAGAAAQNKSFSNIFEPHLNQRHWLGPWVEETKGHCPKSHIYPIATDTELEPMIPQTFINSKSLGTKSELCEEKTARGPGRGVTPALGMP